MANVSSSNGLEKRPKLRFPGFDESYRTTPLGEIASLVNRTDPKSNAPIMMLSAGNGFIMQSEKYSRDNAGQSLKKYILLKQGELAYNHGASKAKQFGCCYELTEPEARIPYVYHCFKINDHEYTPFIAMALNNAKMDKQLKRLVSSSVRMDGLLNISFEDYMSVTLHLPSSTEQKHIADFLKKIDERIAAQEKLLASLKKYKRGVMRAIFRGKAILFSETTKWKSVRLGDECTFFSGGTPRSTDSSFYGGEIPFIRSGEIHGAKTELFLTDDGLKYSSAKLVSKGDLIVALYGATSGEVDISQIDGAINQAILCIRPKLVNRTFLKYLLEDSKDDILNTYLQGGQGNLSAEIIKNLVFDIPDDRSQSAVVDFLDMIDLRISKSLMKLESIATLRSALMQQLFI
jgi:type I restriction enzyme S subunit